MHNQPKTRLTVEQRRAIANGIVAQWNREHSKDMLPQLWHWSFATKARVWERGSFIHIYVTEYGTRIRKDRGGAFVGDYGQLTPFGEAGELLVSMLSRKAAA